MYCRPRSNGTIGEWEKLVNINAGHARGAGGRPTIMYGASSRHGGFLESSKGGSRFTMLRLSLMTGLVSSGDG
jgi:hypothetical protein